MPRTDCQQEGCPNKVNKAATHCSKHRPPPPRTARSHQDYLKRRLKVPNPAERIKHIEEKIASLTIYLAELRTIQAAAEQAAEEQKAAAELAAI